LTVGSIGNFLRRKERKTSQRARRLQGAQQVRVRRWTLSALPFSRDPVNSRRSCARSSQKFHHKRAGSPLARARSSPACNRHAPCRFTLWTRCQERSLLHARSVNDKSAQEGREKIIKSRLDALRAGSSAGIKIASIY
jgi:hypothetical protein